MWGTVFQVTNAVALIGWLILALAPRRPLPLTAVLFLGVGLLCLAYAAMFAGLFSGAVDPVRVAGTEQTFHYDIAGISNLFGTDGGIVLGWTHYLAFDLFVGLWIVKDADAKRIHRLIQLPVLLATFLAGPIGLLAWLILREPAARRRAGR